MMVTDFRSGTNTKDDVAKQVETLFATYVGFLENREHVLVELKEALENECEPELDDLEIIAVNIHDQLGDQGLRLVAEIEAGPVQTVEMSDERYRQLRSNTDFLAEELLDAGFYGKTGSEVVRAMHSAILKDPSASKKHPHRLLGPEVAAAADALLKLVEARLEELSAEADPADVPDAGGVEQDQASQ